ncbi:MAG TPA: alpha-glucosidase [Spirochaetota bacterium]
MSDEKINNERNHIWWKHGVVYQIYPRSFFDTNDDGVGDLRGIIEKIDYLHWLGVDALWLSPVNSSPMHDFGYDISDYRAIDPVFGTLGDFDELLRTAHRKSVRVIMDLVINHTSHLHPWFLESRLSRSNPKRNWYIWRDGTNGMAPNNWISVFGGSAWKYDEITHQYYLHSFLEEQPDLNWRNPELRRAVFADIKFWLDRGVDGFRLDVVNWFMKDKHFRNNPTIFGIDKLQRHIFDRNRPETHDILRELRHLLNSYDNRMSVGEVFSLPPGNPSLSADFLGSGHDELHMAFDFSLIYRFWSARAYYKCIRRWMKKIPDGGWPCHVLSNHDQRRSSSRFGEDDDGAKREKVAAALLLTLKGTPFIYYGEEIGMRNGKIPRDKIVDPLGKKFWPFFPGRDLSRTPMQWDNSPNAGFSSAEPWLPVHADFRKINVDHEMNDRHSLLRFYRMLIELRRRKPSLHAGEWKPVIKGHRGVIGYYRTYKNDVIFVALNFSAKRRKVHIRDHAQWKVCGSTHRSSREHFTDLKFEMAPYEATVIERIGEL